jgi:hypothetical protein
MSDNFQQLQQLTQQPAAVKWFHGLFERAHVEITDTGEQFTVLHRGDSVEVQEGLMERSPTSSFLCKVKTCVTSPAFFRTKRSANTNNIAS